MSNTQATVEDLIDELTDVLEKGWHLPFAGGKSFIDSEDAKQILDEIREAIPSEVRKAKAIVADRAQIISEAQREAETIVRVAEEKAKELGRKIKKAEFDYNDFLDQMNQIKKMGGMASIMSMMPGMGQMKGGMPEVDEKAMDRVEAIILSMTKEERANPGIMNPSRKQRIARGAGVDISEVNRIVKQFDQMQQLMKQMNGKGKKRKLPGKMGGFPGFPGM